MTNWLILHNIFDGTYCLTDKYDENNGDIVIIRELPIGITEDDAHGIYIDFLDIIFPSPIIDY